MSPSRGVAPDQSAQRANPEAALTIQMKIDDAGTRQSRRIDGVNTVNFTPSNFTRPFQVPNQRWPSAACTIAVAEFSGSPSPSCGPRHPVLDDAARPTGRDCGTAVRNASVPPSSST